tara:strand:- start:2359 stop:2727 length:369 start_codon:yes stop_codon:yes gene_type:complete
MIKVSKYEFDSESQANTKINALPSVKDDDGNDVPNHKHTIVKLGNIVLEQGEYDDEGNETKAPVYSTKYHIDVLWNGSEIQEIDEEENITYDHPYGWKTYAIEIDGEGVHSFMGVSYQENKM